MGAYGSPDLMPPSKELKNPKRKSNSSNKRMKDCKICGQRIAKSAKTCPHCGAKNKKRFYKRLWFWILLIIIIRMLAPDTNINDKLEEANVYSNKITSEAYMDSCELIPYFDLARSPDDYLSTDIKHGGQIIQVLKSNNSILYRIKSNDDIDSNFAVNYSTENRKITFIENDYVNFYGEYKGVKPYKTIQGEEVYVPSIDAKYIVIMTKEEVSNEKPKAVFAVGEFAEYDGRMLTVTSVKKTKGSGYYKAEQGKEFIVVHVILTNNSNDTISYSSLDYKLLNDSGQIYSISFRMPQNVVMIDSGDLIPGGTVEGDVVFEESIDSKELILLYYTSFFIGDPTFEFKIQ